MIKDLLKDTVVYGFSEGILKVITFFTFPIVVSLLTVAEYGSLNLVLTITAIAGLFINMGLLNSVQRFYFENTDDHQYQNRLVSTSFFTLLLSAAFFTVLFMLIFNIFDSYLTSEIKVTIKVLNIAILLNIPIQIINFSKNMLRLYFQPLKFIFISILFSILGILLAIYFLFLNYGLEGYFGAQTIVGFLLIPLSLLFFKKNLKLIFDFEVFKVILKYGSPFVMAGLGYWLFTVVDKWIIKYFFDLESVGIYSVGMKFSTLLLFIQNAFSQAWSPYALKIFNENPKSYKKLFSDVLNYFFSLMVILGAAVILLAPEFIKIFLPIEYLQSTTVNMFLVSAVVLNSTTQITLLGISLSKKTFLMNIAVWISVVLNTVLNFILVPLLGVNGAALASFITYVVLTLLYLFYSQKVHYLPFEYKKLIQIMGVLVFYMISSLIFEKLRSNRYIILFKTIILLIGPYYLMKTKIISIRKVKKLFKKS